MDSLSKLLAEGSDIRVKIDAGQIVANFTSYTAYEIRGLVVAENATQVINGTALDTKFRVAISSNLKGAFDALVEGAYIEEEWQPIFSGSDPIAVVAIELPGTYTSKAGTCKTEKNGRLTTCDCFPTELADPNHPESPALASIVTGLNVGLNQWSSHVQMRKIYPIAIGRTIDGRLVREERYTANLPVHMAHGIDQVSLAACLNIGLRLIPSVNPRVAKFFSLGLDENDNVKRFLHFFLSLEIGVHTVYKLCQGADRQSAIALINESKVDLPLEAVNLFKVEKPNTRDLSYKFVISKACVWKHLDKDDVSWFFKLKEARNDIAHGNAAEVPVGFTEQVEFLALKILNSPR